MGCDPVMSRTGHSPIKEKMKELKFPFIWRNEWPRLLWR